MPTAKWSGSPEPEGDARLRPTGLSSSALLNRLAAPGLPAGGVAAAGMAGTAAGLTAMVARAGGGADDQAWACRADGWRGRALALMDADAGAYQRVLAARGDPRRRREALEAASAVPAEVSALAADCAELAARLAATAPAGMRADAVMAVLMASAAARGAALLVAENLPPDAALVRRAAEAADRAAEAEYRVLSEALESGAGDSTRP